MSESPTQTPAPFRVAVVYPCSDNVAPDFAFHLGLMMALNGATIMADGVCDVQMFMLKNTYIDSARDQLARGALDWGATHILWLDSDMIFPKDTLIRLMNRNEAIVGANYCTRRVPALPVAMKKLTPEADERCYTTAESTGLEPVDCIGFGCVLVRRDVFEKIGEMQGYEKPFFLVSFGKDGFGHRGEDVHFCRLAQEVGFSVMVDHDISKEVGHIGTFMYTLEHANAWKQQATGGKKIEVLHPKIEVVSA